jgi:hypothetical protein
MQVRMAALITLNALPMLSRDPGPFREPIVAEKLLFEAKTVMQRTPEERVAMLMAGYYLRAPWSDEGLIALLKALLNRPNPAWGKKLRKILAALQPTTKNEQPPVK